MRFCSPSSAKYAWTTLTFFDAFLDRRNLYVRWPGVPPDLGQTETELLEKAFDAIVGITLPPQTRLAAPTSANKTPRGLPDRETRANAATGNGTAADRHGCFDVNEEGRNREETDPRTPNTVGNLDGRRWSDGWSKPRVPADEIIRVLREGAIDHFRRGSPALSAAYMYRDLAEGLESIAAKGMSDRTTSESENGQPHRHHPALDASEYDCVFEGDGQMCQASAAGDDLRVRGVSKEEFCDYFEAVTDLVDLNGLSLVQHVHPDGVRPWLTSA